MLKGIVDKLTNAKIFDCFKSTEVPVNDAMKKTACQILNKPLNKTEAIIYIKDETKTYFINNKN